MLLLSCGLLLAACGGSSRSSTHATTTAVATTSSTTQVPTSTTSAAASRTTKTSRTITTTATSTHTHTPVAPPPAVGPRVPATYTIAADGTLSPPLISVPAGYRVQLTFVDHGAAATVLVRAPHAISLAVPANGEASKLVTGLVKGTYPVVIGGTLRGSLVIGSAPGP